MNKWLAANVLYMHSRKYVYAQEKSIQKLKKIIFYCMYLSKKIMSIKELSLKINSKQSSSDLSQLAKYTEELNMVIHFRIR